MPVEFIGMIGTKDQSETRLTAGPVIDRDYVRRFARAHEDAGFDRVLIGYASSQPDGAQVAAYAAAHTERLGFLVAHRPGFVAPTLAARTFATLDQFTQGRIAVHIITGGSDAEQRRDGDYLSKDERYARTDEYLDIVQAGLDVRGAVQLRRQALPGRGLLLLASSHRSSRGSGCTSAARRRRPTGSAASTPTPSPCGASRSPRPSSRSTRSTRPPGTRAATDAPGISVSFRPILGPTEELAWERAHRILEATKENVAAFRAQWGAKTWGLGGSKPENVGSQRLLAAAAKGELHDRALWTPLAAATGAGGNSTALVGTPETVAQALLDYVDIGVTTLADPRLRPVRRRDRLRPLPAAAGPRGGRQARRRQGSSRMSSNKRQLKLGAVTCGTGGPGAHYQWLDPEIPVDASVNINWYIEQARLAEQAKFDLIFIVDSQFITADSPPHYLNRLEPLTLLSALAVTTRHLGLVATMTTSYNDPFNLARRLASLELISGGRSGWNVVTSGDAGAAANFSREEHFDYDTRYARGLEFVRVAQGLWDSYEEDAFPRDRASRTFLDPTRQHALNHTGRALPGGGPAQRVPVAAGPAGHLPGRRLRTGPGPGRHDRRGHLHPRGVDRAGPGVLHRHQDPRRSPRAATLTTSSSCPASASTSATPIKRPARSSARSSCPTRTSTRRWRSSAGRSPGTTSASTTWTPRSRRRRSSTPSAGSARTPSTSRSSPGTTTSRSARPCSSSPPQADPVRRITADGRGPDPALVRGPRPRRPQRPHRPPRPVAPLPQGGRPDPPGPRHRPHRVRIHHTARQPRPPHPREPLHQFPNRDDFDKDLKFSHPERSRHPPRRTPFLARIS